MTQLRSLTDWENGQTPEKTGKSSELREKHLQNTILATWSVKQVDQELIWEFGWIRWMGDRIMEGGGAHWGPM